jgi:hypothetical protein
MLSSWPDTDAAIVRLHCKIVVLLSRICARHTVNVTRRIHQAAEPRGFPRWSGATGEGLERVAGASFPTWPRNGIQTWQTPLAPANLAS